jgi:Tfp pilus assembly protein PilN
MPFVNLIKEDRLAAAAKERQIRMFVLLCIAIGGVSFIGAGFFTFEAARYGSKLAALEQALEEAKPYMEKVAKNTSEIGKMEPRLNTLTNAQDATLQWSRIMEHFKSNMPDGVWLTAVQCQRQSPGEPVVVSIKGVSTTQEAVGYLILRIQTSNDIENPQLVYTQERRMEKGVALEFEVKGNLKGSAPEIVKTKEVDAA